MNPLELEDVSHCRLCPLLGKDHVPSSGSPNARVMLIGQSPGATEVEEGQPFCGPSGELIDFLLDEAELSREDVYIANVLKCRPPGNRPGMPQEIRNCRNRWLRHEVAQVKPRIIVLFGRDAFAALGPKNEDMPFAHKAHYKHPKTGRSYLVSYHPGYFLRRGSYELLLEIGTKLRELLNETQSQEGSGD